MIMMHNIIEVAELSHRFSDGTIGLTNINLTVRPGEFVVLAGPNGSGKTTLLRHLNGLLLPTQGKVSVAGMDVARNIAEARQAVGMVFQNADHQIVGETVYDDVAFGPENLCLERVHVEARVREALHCVGMTSLSDQRPHILSGGQKRRLAIAGVLAMAPQILIFDEPFSNLDFPGVQQVLRQILKIHAQGRTIFFATHDLEKVIAHADTLVIMSEGGVVASGAPESILPDVEKYGVRAPCATRLGAKLESWLS